MTNPEEDGVAGGRDVSALALVVGVCILGAGLLVAALWVAKLIADVGP